MLRSAVLVSILAIPGLISPHPAFGQEEATAVLEGQVLQGDTPLESGTVVLHEVGPDSAGELDSVTVSEGGRFSFRLPSVPDPTGGHEVYFASVRYQGILYFGPAIAEAAQLDSIYVVQVYDTIAAPAGGQALPVEVRNLFLESSGDGWQVTDLLQVRNESDRTLVSVGNPVWTYPLPPEASGFTVGQSDLAPDAVAFEGHILQVSAPIPPGERLYVVRYNLPRLDVSIPTPGATERMELLIREPAPPLRAEPLEATQSVELEQGSSYRRYAGRGLAGGSVVLSVVEEGSGTPVRWVAAVLALVLAVAGVIAFRKGMHHAAPVTGSGSGSGSAGGRDRMRRALLVEIARLDEAFHGQEHAEEIQREEYRRKREALKERLRALDKGG